MSLYGNVKRIAASTFQFDRIYGSRKEMENACSFDGVYAGRYVLVNYGYGTYYFKDDQGNPIYDSNGNPRTQFYPGDRYVKVGNAVVENGNGGAIQEENPLYKEQKELDMREYGAVYDSTVWQKIYGPASGEKYIMVAELNALAPKFELVLQDPLIYAPSSEEHPKEDIYVVDQDENEHQAAVKVRDAYESYAQPTFDLVHSNELSYYLNFPKNVNFKVDNEDINYNQEGFDIVYSMPKDSNDYNSYIIWEPEGINKNDVASGQTVTTDSKKLYMNLPQFGNLMQTLYDLIYGVPQDDTKVRPFFKTEWTNAGNVGADPANDIEGEPRTIENDDEEWLINVPDIGEILANNTEGLAGILSSLFTERDPLSGTVRYYLITDWASNQDINTSSPFITRKPEVIGYTSGENVSPCDLKIDYSAWKLLRV